MPRIVGARRGKRVAAAPYTGGAASSRRQAASANRRVASQGVSVAVPDQVPPSRSSEFPAHDLRLEGQTSASPGTGEFENTKSVDILPSMFPSSDPPNTLVSVCDSIDSHVPMSLREKIWRSEYIELGLLLKGDQELRDMLDSASVQVNRRGLLEMKPRPSMSKVDSIETWTSGFLIFASVYLSKYPHRTREILKYIHTIRLAASRFGGDAFRLYDEQFRIRQARHPNNSWATVNAELWLTIMIPSQTNAIHVAPTQPQYHPKTGKNARLSPTGICYDYNGKGCSRLRCKFPHRCSSCGLGHPQSQCRSFRFSHNTKQGTQSAVSVGKKSS